jgi:hypothetical protein
MHGETVKCISGKYDGAEVRLHAFVTSELEGCHGQTHSPDTYPGKDAHDIRWLLLRVSLTAGPDFVLQAKMYVPAGIWTSTVRCVPTDISIFRQTFWFWSNNFKIILNCGTHNGLFFQIYCVPSYEVTWLDEKCAVSSGRKAGMSPFSTKEFNFVIVEMYNCVIHSLQSIEPSWLSDELRCSRSSRSFVSSATDPTSLT